MGQGGTPTNEVVATIGTAKDHTDIVTWEAATDDDCVNGFGVGIYSSPCSPVGEAYDTGDFSGNLTITGATTDSTHYRRLTVAAGERHSGDFPKVDTGAKNTGFIMVDEDYAEVEWLLIDTAAQSSFSAFDVQGGQDVLLRNMICDAPASKNNAFRVTPGNSKNAVVENCIGITRRAAASAYSFRSDGLDGTLWRNCTAYGVGNNANVRGFGQGEPTNCIAIVRALAIAFTTPEGSGNYNIGSDTTAPGANSIDNETAAGLFADTTGDAEDLHLKDDATAASGAGTDLSAFFTDDIDGDTRSDWDIGADEVVGAPAGNRRRRLLLGASA